MFNSYRLLLRPPRAEAGGGVRTRRGAELRKRASVCSAACKVRKRRSTPGAKRGGIPPPPPPVCLCARSLKVFDGAIVFKPHIVKVSLAGHGVGRADGVCSCGLDGYFAVGC